MTAVASPIPLPAREWSERGRRDIDHVTRGARVREWAVNESMLSELAPVMTTTLSLIPGIKFYLL
jgi:hypothetical protein